MLLCDKICNKHFAKHQEENSKQNRNNIHLIVFHHTHTSKASTADDNNNTRQSSGENTDRKAHQPAQPRPKLQPDRRVRQVLAVNKTQFLLVKI